MSVEENQTIKIAIDGPSAAGKSTLAKALSSTLNFVYLDTGALYRSLAWYILEQNILSTDEKNIAEILPTFSLELKEYDKIPNCPFVNGRCIKDLIRNEKIAKAASDCSTLLSVRQNLLTLQRSLANKYNVVLEGRDITSYVLPDADLKIFLTASLEERAKRRFLEQQKNNSSSFTLLEIKQALSYRDEQDTSRKIAPLIQTEDAYLVDSTYLSLEEVKEFVLSLYYKKIGGSYESRKG